jgi:hypothetical protein
VLGTQIPTYEPLAALLTLKGLHIGVGKAVLLLIVLVLEDPVAEVAWEDRAGGVVGRLDVRVEAAVPFEGLVAELALEHVPRLMAPHVDLEVALIAVGAGAHVAHVQVLLTEWGGILNIIRNLNEDFYRNKKFSMRVS